jgi:hypothetical protein
MSFSVIGFYSTSELRGGVQGNYGIVEDIQLSGTARPEN